MSMPKLVRTERELKAALAARDRKNKTLGFVPTMGYLHAGHLSLIRAARAENDLVVVSVFVNPMQFGPGEDFTSYPRNIERDYELAVSAGADLVFHPETEEIYVPGASTAVEVTGSLTEKLCGASRPGHFKGVATVVSILFHIVGPDRAYFGQKDAQQVLIIRKMVRDLHMPLDIVACPIVREADGLAMSSRNVYLNEEARRQALSLSRSLKKAGEYFRSGNEDSRLVQKLRSVIRAEIEAESLARIDYVELLDGQTLEEIKEIKSGKTALAAVAVRFGKTRLIDNCLLGGTEKG